MRLLSLVALVLLGCSPAVAPTAERGYCEAARALGCPEGDPTPEGASCEVVLRETTAAGIPYPEPSCVERARDCASLSHC